MKLFKTFPLLLIFLGLIPGCCPDVDPFYQPTEMSVTAIWNNSPYTGFEDLTIENADGFELWIEFTQKQFLSSTTPSFSFATSLMATQPCPEDGHEGLKSPVSSLTITSNSEFQEVPAGENLNQYFHRLEPSGADEQGNQAFEPMSVDSELGRFHFLSYYEGHIPVYLSELPENNLEHEFSIELVFEDGTTISGVSAGVQF